MPDPPPPQPALVVERHGPALVLRMSNPARANAMDPGILDALRRHVQEPGADVRVVLLSGEGDRHFSAGLDLADADGAALAARLREGEATLGRTAAAIADCAVPVVAVVNGAAFGGALELAIACDWRIAADGARMGMPAARLGVVYAPDGMARFVACLGPSRTRQLFLTGRPVDARRALEIGLVDEVVPAAELWDRAHATAADVVAAAPLAAAGTRAAVTALSGRPGPDAVAEVERWRDRAYASEEFTEALAAFRERRPPGWVR